MTGFRDGGYTQLAQLQHMWQYIGLLCSYNSVSSVNRLSWLSQVIIPWVGIYLSHAVLVYACIYYLQVIQVGRLSTCTSHPGS